MSQVSGQGVPDSGPSRGRKSVPWKRDPSILARLPRVERLHLAGRTLVAIGTELGIDEGTVRNDLKRVQELWHERAGGDIAGQRAQIIAELDDTRRRALEAAEWDQMCERAVLFGLPIERRVCPGGVDHSPYGDLPPLVPGANDALKCKAPHEIAVVVQRDAKGSAQFRGNKAASLAQARQATMDKAKILGIDVSKVALTDSNGDDISLDELMERFGGGPATGTAE